MIFRMVAGEKMRMSKEILGLHHVTAIAGDPQKNIDFYVGVLGLRLVKLTVNFDDPGTYHLYYGDEIGHPGTILTFFPWPGGEKGRQGTGQLTVIYFSVPDGSLDYWVQRLKKHGVRLDLSQARFGEKFVSFRDPDDLKLELVENATDKRKPWMNGPISPEMAIRGFYGVTVTEEEYERTAALLNDTLGFNPTKKEDNRFRYPTAQGGPGNTADVLCSPELPAGYVSVGTVHDVAWRTPDDEQQREWREEMVKLCLNVTPVIDRKYFHSIYFREPGGVLLEIATDPPGFTVDEPVAELGSKLVLPSWLEPQRKQIEEVLPLVHAPKLSAPAK
jgi:catechol 2,3-dioxygenase-like lactoylglutathione lyase family enzyme